MGFYMTTLRQYLTLFVPTLALLMSMHIYNYIDKLVTQYTNSVNQQYSIVIISKQILNENNIKETISSTSTIKQIPTKGSIAKFKEILSKKNFASLTSSIPYFYQLKLTTFPSKKELLEIKKILLRNDKIIKVETFLKKYSSFNIMLINTKKIVIFFTAIIFILSFVLILKITEVWYFEHKNRLDVMKLLGASIYQRSQVLLKISFVNSIVGTFLIVTLFYYLYNSHTMLKLLSSLGIPRVAFGVYSEIISSFGISFGVSLSIVLFLMLKNK